VKEITSRKEAPEMNNNPFERFVNMVGMYAYLAAVGGLDQWPALRRSVLQETPAPKELVEREESLFEATVPYEYDEKHEGVPAA
jgi:hypothetical protein